MKAIIFAAIFALVAQASLLDTTSYTLGFTDQLGFDSVETSTGIQCFTSINNTVANVEALLQSFSVGASDVTISVLNLIATANGPLKQNCEDYVSDLIAYAANFTNVTETDELEWTVESNARRYYAQLIQLVTLWIDSVQAGNEYQAGATEAQIIQILIGAVTPADIVYPDLSYEDYVPVNYTQMILETYSTFYNQLGFNGEVISEAYLQCYNNATVAVPVVQEFLQNFENATGLDKVEVVRTAFDDLSFVLEACAPVLQVSLEIYAPVLRSLERNPIGTILTIVHNVASNLPELQQSNINAGVDVFYGNYTQAGIETAFELFAVFAGAGY